MLFDDTQSYTAFKSSCRLSQSVTSHTPEYRLATQLASMDSRFFLKLFVYGRGLLSLKLRHWLYLDKFFLTITVHPFRIIP